MAGGRHVKFGTDRNHTHIPMYETVCKLTINVPTIQNFEVITDNFNIYKKCTSVVSSQS